MEVKDLLDMIDIVDYISEYVELEQRGDEYWGLSPFKKEKTPSFSVRRETGKFYDYSSGIGGSLVTFLKFYHNISSSKAIEMLEEYAGVSGTEYKKREKLSATMSCKKYARPVREQKEPKGIVLASDYMNRYEIREDKYRIWLEEGISRQSLDKFGVRYDPSANRLVYPIRDLSGNIVNVGGRTLNPDWKERGERKYNYYYKWGSMNIIYGLYDNLTEIKKKREVILFEGMKSVLKADSWGIGNTGCLLTSHCNPAQMKLLAALGCRVVFALDKEVDIRKDHNISILKNYVNVEYVWDYAGLLDEKDAPVDKGKEVFLKVYEDRRRYR